MSQSPVSHALGYHWLGFLADMAQQGTELVQPLALGPVPAYVACQCASGVEPAGVSSPSALGLGSQLLPLVHRRDPARVGSPSAVVLHPLGTVSVVTSDLPIPVAYVASTTAVSIFGMVPLLS